jgi:hypothetical protein
MSKGKIFDNTTTTSAKPHFAVWWNATHKKPEKKFEASPWVWSIQFEIVK